MTNWRRGFFRVWVLLTILWGVFLGLINFGNITNPYISETLFTFNKDDKLEVVPLFGDRYSKMLTDERNGYYNRVSFEGDAPRVFYMAPNLFKVELRGKTYEAVVSNERLDNPDREGLVTSMIAFIQKNDPNLSPPVTADEVRAALPNPIKLEYHEPWIEEQTRQFAVEVSTGARSDARTATIFAMIFGMIIPPLVVLLLGSGIGWALSGFRRERTDAA
jgi:hypothetical protein